MKEWPDKMNEGQFLYQFPDCLQTMCRFSINGGEFTKERQSFDSVDIAFNFNHYFKRMNERETLLKRDC